MDSSAIKAIVNAAGNRNIEIRSTDASIIYTKSKGTHCYFNFDKSCVVCMRNNDDASNHISKPIEVTVWDFNDINHMTIVGDMNDAISLLEGYNNSGLITTLELDKFKKEIINNDSLKAYNATTSIENYSDALGNRAAVRNASGYGDVDRKNTEPYKQEIIKLGDDKNV